MSLIELHHVSKIYHEHTDREVRALDDVSLTIDTGEFVAIVGASGSGKTTLMNCLGCLDVPTRGQYLLNGSDVAQMKNRALTKIRSQTIGFIFQGFNLIPELTALENTALPLQYRGVPAAERLAAAKQALTDVGLAHRLHHRPAQLSGGQQQRVAIARVLAADPAILLADEPTGNLDSASGNEVMALLRRLHRSGRTVILITHDPQIAASAPRIIHLSDGRITKDFCPNLLL